MRFGFLSALALSLPLLAACTGPAPPLGDSVHVVDRQKTAVATIKGYSTPKSFLGAQEWTVIDAIDGKYAFYLSDIRNGIPLAPGPHAIVVAYHSGGSRFLVAFRLEARANESYVAKWREVDGGLLGLEGSTVVSIENAKTGEKVTPENRIHGIEPGQQYVEPSGPPETLATISATRQTSLFETSGAAFLQSVDGKTVEKKPGFLGISSEYDYTASFKLSPGLHALGIGIVAFEGSGHWVLPVMFDVRPGAHYKLRFEKDSQRADTTGEKWKAVTVWMTDETRNGEIVLPKTSIPVMRDYF
ncbi:hypothetical protein [Parvibaculum sp.]|uniref:hypothetical protein n=1 Tax=Parvibaculum sp. TaxID=2024848 RepID=UPI000C95CF76|nr:hypothetical protein [Parvibaculum sp.]MAB14374.1 hypothetical protein [Parvibaculum sp.]